MVYTSGTTGRPKGVITTRGALEAQIATLAAAWEWTADDRSLHVLPLHHVHGIVNALSCALWVGASVEFLDPFDPVRAWDRLASGEITFFTAVPTIYHRLIVAWDAADAATRTRWSAGARGLRLMLSGSAALPVGVFTGLAMFIPYVGFGIGLVLALLAGLLQFASWYGVVAVAVVYGVGQVGESLYLTPRLVGERIGMNPLMVIFALLAFGHLFGFVGVLIALPLSAVLVVAVRRLRVLYLESQLYRG